MSYKISSDRPDESGRSFVAESLGRYSSRVAPVEDLFERPGIKGEDRSTISLEGLTIMNYRGEAPISAYLSSRTYSVSSSLNGTGLSYGSSQQRSALEGSSGRIIDVAA